MWRGSPAQDERNGARWLQPRRACPAAQARRTLSQPSLEGALEPRMARVTRHALLERELRALALPVERCDLVVERVRGHDLPARVAVLHARAVGEEAGKRLHRLL